jgi:hypothetical protein
VTDELLPAGRYNLFLSHGSRERPVARWLDEAPIEGR